MICWELYCRVKGDFRMSSVKCVDVILKCIARHSLLLMKGSLHKKMHSLVMSFGNSTIIRDHLLLDIDRLVRLNMESWSDWIFLGEEAKKITFELSVKQLLSLDPCEWTERLRKEYVLVIERFFSLPLSIFSPTYKRAIKTYSFLAYLKHVKHKKLHMFANVKAIRLELSWQTENNGDDCGIFTMRHMVLAFALQQNQQLVALRDTYSNVILRSNLNARRDKVLQCARDGRKLKII